MLFGTAAAVSLAFHLATIYDLFQDTIPKCWHYAGIKGEPIML